MEVIEQLFYLDHDLRPIKLYETEQIICRYSSVMDLVTVVEAKKIKVLVNTTILHNDTSVY